MVNPSDVFGTGGCLRFARPSVWIGLFLAVPVAKEALGQAKCCLDGRA